MEVITMKKSTIKFWRFVFKALTCLGLLGSIVFIGLMIMVDPDKPNHTALLAQLFACALISLSVFAFFANPYIAMKKICGVFAVIYAFIAIKILDMKEALYWSKKAHNVKLYTRLYTEVINSDD